MPAVTFPTEPTHRELGDPVYVSNCKGNRKKPRREQFGHIKGLAAKVGTR